jgi:ferritin-like metal-binding protein YciE
MRQQMISWLSDAHAMEMQAIQLLENQARRIESYPDLRNRILEHLEETRGQIERLEGVHRAL